MAEKNASPVNEDPISVVKQFYNFMSSRNLEVVEYSKDDTYIKLVRKHTPVSQPVHLVNAPAEIITEQKKETVKQVRQEDDGTYIKAPLAGIFYRAPSPSSPPYIRDGDQVKEGQVICVIEAMKVFNELKAEYDCTVKKVVVDNGTPVDTGDVLFIVERL
uniref:Biotin carboxyl carrier protein of acetyl-CoA carboxylase n=1 Tax=uncultured bacterium URE12 TaxID=581111 RepID=C0JZU4_9BACT|nr:acetyl-CoA carboxylase biotin carboxyl carrier protein [uncultured bacterium URE12]